MSENNNLLPSGLPRIESLEMRGIVKRFPGVLASDHVDFDVKTGEIHALLGENGAGKSTLMKILYGLYKQDEGDILLNGQVIDIQSPTDSINHGIGMIHQHFMLVDNAFRRRKRGPGAALVPRTASRFGCGLPPHRGTGREI